MIVDAATCPDTPSGADVVIAGAGPAGIVIAERLGASGVNVLLLESGGRHAGRRTQRLNRADSVGLRSFSAAVSRFRCFGGSTSQWGGQCRPLDAADFDARDDHAGSGWPFGVDELLPYYRQAARVCRLPSGFDETPWYIAQSTADGAHGVSRISYLFSYPRDFGELYFERFSRLTTVRVLLHATVTRIRLNRSARRVSALTVRTPNGRQFEVSAGTTILAGGGIENPRLLLASDDVVRCGIGNENDLVGRYFSDHPYAFVGSLRGNGSDAAALTIDGYDGVGITQPGHQALCLDDATVKRERLNPCALYLVRRPSYKATAEYYSRAGRSFNYLVDLLRRRETADRSLLRELGNVLAAPADVAGTIARAVRHAAKTDHTLAVRVAMASRPHRDSRVMLGTNRDWSGLPIPRIDWRLHDDDRRGPRALLEAASGWFAANGLGRLVEIPWDEDSGWPRGMTGGKHHMGTTRMHVNPRHGVVDANGKVHGVDDLYVAGSSVFPAGGYANPTLTIVALALRLADRLQDGATAR
ncbi:MAG: GMC family oxidoreductase [Pseudomonadota bacterium]